MHRTLIRTAAIFGALSVLLGAFGAHTLKNMIGVENISSFQTGVTYQFYHSIVLMVLGLVYKRYPNKYLEWASLLFIAGIILFSGSLYVLTFLQATRQVGLGGLGVLTPIGGVLLVAGWMAIFFGVPASKKPEKE